MTVLFLRRVPVPGMETHIPVLFLDLSGTLFSSSFTSQFPFFLNPVKPLTFPVSLLPPADDFQSSLSATLAGGLDASLSGEDDDEFFDLHIVKHFDPEVRGLCVC